MQITSLIFFTFTLEEYKVATYIVVSVAPIIHDEIIPNFESTPKSFIIFVAIAVVVLPEIGLTKANGNISLGIDNLMQRGSIKIAKACKALLFIKTSIEDLSSTLI